MKRLPANNVGVVAYANRIAVPTRAMIRAGVYFAVEPIFVCSPNLDDLTTAISSARNEGHPTITVEEFNALRHRQPILRALRVRSWAALARGGASLAVYWREDRTVINVSRVDAKGRFEDDPEHRVDLSASASVESVASVMLDDLRRRGMLD